MGSLPAAGRSDRPIVLEKPSNKSQVKIKDLEGRTAELLGEIKALELIETLPGVAFIPGVVILTQVGDVERFPSASHLASSAGMTPSVHASGGHVGYGRTRSDVNHYLK